MSTSQINSITTPENTAPPLVPEDLASLRDQLVLNSVQIFASNSDRATKYGNLGYSPPVGALSYRIDSAAYERYNGTGSPTLSTSWSPLIGVPTAYGVNGGVAAGTKADAAYGDFPATSSFSFTKKYTETKVQAVLNATLFSTATVTVVKLGVRINAVDYDVASYLFNAATDHRQVAGVRHDIGTGSAIPAGVYTAQVRWLRTSGAGTLTTDTSDWLSCSLMEVL